MVCSSPKMLAQLSHPRDRRGTRHLNRSDVSAAAAAALGERCGRAGRGAGGCGGVRTAQRQQPLRESPRRNAAHVQDDWRRHRHPKCAYPQLTATGCTLFFETSTALTFQQLLQAGISRPTGSAEFKATCTARSTLSPGGGRTIVDLRSSGGARTFTLALPSSSSAQMPLLLALHGGAQYASGFLDVTAFDTAGPAAGYVVAAPDGLPGSGGVGGTWALNNDPADGAGDVYNDVDDKAFVRDVVSCIRSLGVSLSGDLYVTGWSLGAKFATRLACAPAVNNATVPLRVVALTVASGVQAETERACAGAPVPLLMIQARTPREKTRGRPQLTRLPSFSFAGRRRSKRSVVHHCGHRGVRLRAHRPPFERLCAAVQPGQRAQNHNLRSAGHNACFRLLRHLSHRAALPGHWRACVDTGRDQSHRRVQRRLDGHRTGLLRIHSRRRHAQPPARIRLPRPEQLQSAAALPRVLHEWGPGVAGVLLIQV